MKNNQQEKNKLLQSPKGMLSFENFYKFNILQNISLSMKVKLKYSINFELLT